MQTEITEEKTNREKVCYDAECGFGVATVNRINGLLGRLGFWIVRLFVAIFVFDVRPYLTNRFLRLGYHATNVVFIYLVAVYAFAAWKGGHL